MAELRLTAAARADLEKMDSEGAAMFGKAAADAYGAGLRRALDRLELYPLSAPARPDYGSAIRSRPYHAHRIIHRVEATR